MAQAVAEPGTEPDLPLIDEHGKVVGVEADSTWTALLETLERPRRSRRNALGARLLGCVERSGNGRPLAQVGATIPGFRVVESTPPSRLALRGRHRFSDYLLQFDLAPVAGNRTSIRARTLAEFPGASGWVYRQLVIGSRIHVAAVNSILLAVKRRAEGSPRGPRR